MIARIDWSTDPRGVRISELVAHGHTSTEIAPIVGLGRETVRQIKAALGLPSDTLIQRERCKNRRAAIRVQLDARRQAKERHYHEILAASMDGKAPDECWPWLGTRFKTGYGYAGRRNKKQNYAHRFSWEQYFGAIPVGLSVLHRCDNPPCVNPAHLFLGTQSDNIRDAIKKGRWHQGWKRVA